MNLLALQVVLNKFIEILQLFYIFLQISGWPLIRTQKASVAKGWFAALRTDDPLNNPALTNRTAATYVCYQIFCLV